MPRKTQQRNERRSIDGQRAAELERARQAQRRAKLKRDRWEGRRRGRR